MRKLRVLTIAVAALIVVIGLIGLAAPSVLLEFATSLLTPTALYVVAAVRVAFGVLLVWIAPTSRMPTILRVIGAVIVVLGLLTPFLGVHRTHAMLASWSGLDPILMRAAPSLAVLFGLFIIYAVVNRGLDARHN